MQHLPVLVEETLALLEPRRGGIFVDVTLGLGGHAEALLRASDQVQLVGIDRDPQALELAARRLAPFGERVRFVNANFHHLEQALAGIGITGKPAGIAGVLADLGVSSMQLDTPERGFSFRFDAPLDMRMGLAERTAADLVNEGSEGELEKIIRDYGEERQARRIARSIVDARREQPIETTGQLKRLIERVKGSRPPWQEGGSRVDPATLVFQALRIAVNDELAGLEGFIQQAIDLLEDDGRMVIISYHSLEDRIVKNALRDRARGEIDQVTGRPHAETQLIEALTRKPIRPSEEEVARNPRSRSARLRAARRI
ncbi:MAG: rRNA (cytosine1402-N4)-methyltransferase [Acidobacteriota bacterium]|jgi:16S rRNA (cytosine1402-N4)-methyltransferase|nr:rRNA (cytosine1402-N4)-methyltransferase [Acidobacteriota bacterium]